MVVAACCLLQSCAGGAPGPEQGSDTGIRISGVIIRNELAYPVSDAMILVPSTGRFASCGNIMQRSRCSTSFPAADYRQLAIVISWKERGEPQSTDEFIVKVPARMAAGADAWLEVIVFSKGQAGARLVSDPGP